MAHFTALTLLAAVPTRSIFPIRTQREMRRHRPAWLTGRMTGLAGDAGLARRRYCRRSKSAPCFGVRGRRGETQSSQPSCDTNSAATRCSGGGGPRCCERPATWLAQVGRERRVHVGAPHAETSTAAQSPQSMRAKRQVGRRRVCLFIYLITTWGWLMAEYGQGHDNMDINHWFELLPGKMNSDVQIHHIAGADTSEH